MKEIIIDQIEFEIKEIEKRLSIETNDHEIWNLKMDIHSMEVTLMTVGNWRNEN